MTLLSSLPYNAIDSSLSSCATEVTQSETNNSFATRTILPPGTITVDGQLNNEKVNFYTLTGLVPGDLFTTEVNSQLFDPLLGQLDDSGNILAINNGQSDNNVLPILTGTIPVGGSLNFAVSGNGDINLAGDHFQYGPYTLSLQEFPIPQLSTNSTLINGGFETRDFTGWTSLGSTSVETAAFGSGPTEGTYQSLLSTGGAAFSSSIIEKVLGLDLGSLNNLDKGNATTGSAIQQAFTANAGDTLTFNYDFLTNEVLPPVSNADFAFVSIKSQSDSSINSLSDLADATNATLATSPTKFFNETGFHTFSFTIPTTGTYSLGLGVTNVGDTSQDSGLLVDHVQLTPSSNPLLS